MEKMIVTTGLVVSGSVWAGPAQAAEVAIDSSTATTVRTIVRTTSCEQGGTITTTIRRNERWVSVSFELSGALPLEQYGFGAEWVAKQRGKAGQPGSYDGATATSLFGTADLAGFAAPVKSRVTYRFVAYSSRNQCFAKGFVRPA
ncbi:hypothetical protein [Nocardioides psychrotolerans]|nr:hypothetical protein [Nocardioides psychrotolerans]